MGKVAEWEAPCHQYALVEEEVEREEGEDEEELDDVSESDKNNFQFESNDTDRDRKKNWKVAELERDQVECVLSSWKYREKAGDDSIVKGMLEDMIRKQRIWGIFASLSS